MDATNRHILYIDYTGPMGDRVHGVGCEVAYTPASAIEAWSTTVALALSPLWHVNVDVIGVRWQALGTNFTIPVELPLPIAGSNPASFTPNEFPVQLSVVMRSFTTGQRTRAYFFGVPITPPDDYRYEPGNLVAADALVDAFVDACGQGLYVADDGSLTRPNPYVNSRYNSYWQRRYRALL